MELFLQEIGLEKAVLASINHLLVPIAIVTVGPPAHLCKIEGRGRRGAK